MSQAIKYSRRIWEQIDIDYILLLVKMGFWFCANQYYLFISQSIEYIEKKLSEKTPTKSN